MTRPCCKSRPAHRLSDRADSTPYTSPAEPVVREAGSPPSHSHPGSPAAQAPETPRRLSEDHKSQSPSNENRDRNRDATPGTAPLVELFPGPSENSARPAPPARPYQPEGSSNRAAQSR